jgi:predicted RNA binding protein YcfA (HicA-like mRNA interferase family)
MRNDLEEHYDKKFLEAFKNNNLGSNDKIFEILNKNIVHQEQDLCNILKDTKKILTNNLYNDFISLFESIIEMNNRFVGKNINDTGIKLNDNGEFIYIKDQLILLTKEYCDNRIKKQNNRDKNNLFKTLRIALEVTSTFTLFTSVKESINLLFFKDIFIFIPHYLKNKLILQDSYENNKIYKLYNMLNISSNGNMDLNELKEQVKNLSANIRNMKKHFLDKDINKIVIMENKYYLKFNWLFTDNYILSLHIDNISLHVDHKGYLIDKINYIEYIYEDYKHNEHLQLNLFILEKINSHLKDIFNQEKINHLENELALKSFEENKKNDILIEDKIENKPKSKSKSKSKNNIQITAKRLKEYIKSIGYIEISRTGSHIKYRNEELSNTCTFADKKDTYIYKRGSLKIILKQYNKILSDIYDYFKK